jgi:ssDNA-binding replication factor A large subunit
MYDFEMLVNEVLRSRSELNRDKLTKLIDDKKKTVGGGYLTDQGALFLIAGELGVQLKHLTSSDLTLKDIYLGANDITLVARVLAIYPIMEYQRKDGTKGRYRRLTLFDKSSIVRLTAWDDENDTLEFKGITVDTPVRVVSGYVKPGLDGKPNLNLGKRGRIEVITDRSLISKLASLESLARNLDSLANDSNIVAVEGTASSNSRSSTFTRGDGSHGSMFQFELSGDKGSEKKRVVVWDGLTLPEVRSGTRLRVTNLRMKKIGENQIELHGDSGSEVQVLGSQPANATLNVTKVNAVKDAGEQVNLEVIALSKGSIHDVTLKDGTVVKKGEMVVGDDTGEITVVGWRELSDKLRTIEVGEKLLFVGAAHQPTKMGTEILQMGHSTRIEKVPRK